MRHTERIVALKHEGEEYSAAYTVNNGMVDVMMRDSEGIYRKTSTSVDGAPIESVAKLLLGELLSDVDFI